MEFWGLEVKSGEPGKVAVGDGMVVHISQACLGELKKEKGNESAYLFVDVEGKKFVLGTLFTEKLPQQQFDLVFDRDFELSHNWKSGSVYFCGYKARNEALEEGPGGELDESESEDEIPLTVANNGKPETKAKQEKSLGAQKPKAGKDKESDYGKQKVKIVEPKKGEEDGSSDDDSMSEDDDEDDSEDEDDSDDSEEEETPRKIKIGKKRAAESAAETPVQGKKAKVSSQKTDGKKASGHVATPHPAKRAGKTPASRPTQQSQKSGASNLCKSCNKTFVTEKALESHTKAKHG